MTWMDISVPITEELPVWPGNPPLRVDRLLDVCCGDEASVSQWTLGAHTGTHVDAPAHFIAGAPSLAEIPLQEWCGPCRVVALPGCAAITLHQVEALPWQGVTKVLFKTDNSLWVNHQPWYKQPFNPHFVAVSLEAAQYLVAQGIALIGVDYLSVEAYGSVGAPVHRALLQANVRIVEGLNLTAVEPGDYQLYCFPLAMAHAAAGDGALARVALQPQ
ncbi:MAG: cyclase family protein [Vampirovibrionales bacterium]